MMHNRLFTFCIVILTLLLHQIDPISAHDHFFPNNPEWNTLWPQSPQSTLNVKLAALPSLSGLWTGSPAGGATHRYWFTQSGGGYGTNKDNWLPKEPVTEPVHFVVEIFFLLSHFLPHFRAPLMMSSASPLTTTVALLAIVVGLKLVVL